MASFAAAALHSTRDARRTELRAEVGALAVGVLAAIGCHDARSSPNSAGTGGQAGESGNVPSGAWIVRGAEGAEGEAIEFGVDGDRVVPAGDLPSSATVLDLTGYFVVPAFIDSHVHLSYYAVADSLPAGGIVAAVDFAAPIASLELEYPIPVLRAGPMITPVAGYPTQSWGSGGYGLEVASVDEAVAAADRLLDAGASFLKAPLMAGQGLDDATLAAVVERAHARGAKVASHATAAADATRAIASEIDILAHTPTDALADDVLDGWGERAVVSTLAAFGTQGALQNLRALADRGARVLYGTDLGNTREARIQLAELEGLVAAGFRGSEIVRAGTRDAADFWGFDELGRLEPGRRASFLLLDESPEDNPRTLAAPRAVVVDGRVAAGALP